MYGGMNKGQVVEERSALLASRGFASLALAFFGAKDLPKNYFDLGILMFYQKLISYIVVFMRSILCYIELDYFEEAVDFLYRQNYVKTSQGIGVVGISKAAEIALLMGTYFEDKVILHKYLVIKSKN